MDAVKLTYGGLQDSYNNLIKLFNLQRKSYYDYLDQITTQLQFKKL